MKKIYFIFLLTISILLSPLVVKANTEFCYNLKASVGETYSEVGIIYHSKVEGTVVRYGTDSTLTEYLEAEPTETIYSKGQTNGQVETVFDARFVCRANLTNLSENTTYYYQVVSNNEKSQIQSFKTQNPDKLTFGVLCDTQAAGSAFAQSNELVNKLVSINNNINFFMIAGDIVDRGGYEVQWNYLDQYMTTINQKYLQATIPGNHELYHSSLPNYIDASIYNQYYFNPQNGPKERLNSSYYFMQNDVLFIMLDIMHRSNGDNFFEEQIAWFKDVVENNPAKFVIVVSHPGAYSTGVYESDAKLVNSTWRSVFEEYGVDLAISGHEHLYARTQPLYNEIKDTNKGVTYVIGGAAGQKSYSAEYESVFDVIVENDSSSGQYSGSICEIEGDTLKFSFYRKDGTLKDSFTLTSKRHIAKDFNITEFMDSIKIDYDEVSCKSSIVWDNNAYGNIENIKIIIKFNNNYELIKYVGPNSNTALIGTTYPTKDYEYDIVVTDYEGNEYTKTLLLDNDETLNEPTNMKLQIIESSEGVYDVTVSYSANNTSLTSLELIYNNKTFEFTDNKLQLTNVTNNITADDVKLEMFYRLFNNGKFIEFDKTNMEIIIENLPENNQSSNSNNCKLGFVSLLPLFGAATIMLIKRKH